MISFHELLIAILHPNIYSGRVVFFVIAALVIGLLILVAKLLKLYFPKLSIGVLVISMWALVISTAFFFDYLEIKYYFFWVFIILVTLGFIVYTFRKFKLQVKNVLKNFVAGAGMKLLVTWIVAVLMILLPSILILKTESFIPAPQVTNDSVMHGILSEGHAQTRDLSLDKYYDDEYPRGYHSLIFLTSKLTNLEPYMLLFSMAVFGYSFIIFFVQDILKEYKIEGIKKYLAMLFPVAPYLIMISLYGLYLPQIVVIPVLLTAVHQVFILERKEYFRIFIIFILSITVMNVYGIYAFSAILAAIGIKFILLGIAHRSNIIFFVKNLTQNLGFDLRKHLIYILTIGVPFIILAIPSCIVLFRNTISSFEHRGLTFAQGTKFLSPLHITGIWGDDYFKDDPGRFIVYILFLIFTIQLYFIFKKRLKKPILLMAVAFGGLVLAGFLYFKSDYIEFKYLSFFVPLYLTILGLNVTLYLQENSTNKFIKFIGMLTMVGFIVIELILPLQSYKLYNSFGSEFFSEYQQIKSDYMDKYPTLTLVGDSWFQYFKDQKDDFAPLYGWYFTKYNNEEVNYIIIDKRALQNDNSEVSQRYNDFLKGHSEIKESITNTPNKCISKTVSFYIYQLNCPK